MALRFCRWGFPVSDACLRELSCVVLRLVWRGDGFLRTNWPPLGRAPYTEPLAEELFSSPFAWGFHVARMSLHYPFGCWTRFPFRRRVFALYSPRSLRRLDLRATSGASMGERACYDPISNTKLLATMPCDLDLSSPNAAVSFCLAIRTFVLIPFGRCALLLAFFFRSFFSFC